MLLGNLENMTKSKKLNITSDSPLLFDLTRYTEEIKHHPDWEDMQGDEDATFTSSHVGLNSSHVGAIDDSDVPTCEQIYQWVEVYPVKQINYYFRYSYIDRSASIPYVGKMHIPGGNTKSSIAIGRKNTIENAIKSGGQPPQIEAMIKAWRKQSKPNGGK